MAGLPVSAAERLRTRVRRLTRIDEGRYSLELGPHERPEPLIAELTLTGASLVSVTPLNFELTDTEALPELARWPIEGFTRSDTGGSQG